MSATKIYLVPEFAGQWNFLRMTKANQMGLLRFGGRSETNISRSWSGSRIAYLVNRKLVVGAGMPHEATQSRRR